jgi:hypothetical protein
MIAKLGGSVSALGRQTSLFGSLGANLNAANRVTDRIARMGRAVAHPVRPTVSPIATRVLSPELDRFVDLPLPPPNPLYETNRLLGEQAEHIGEMRQLAADTAEMQRSLNEIALKILGEFNEGARTAERASSKALKVSQIGLWVAIGSAVLTALALVASIGIAGYETRQDLARDQAAAKLAAATERTRAADAVAIQAALAVPTTALDLNTAALQDAAAAPQANPRPSRAGDWTARDELGKKTQGTER